MRAVWSLDRDLAYARHYPAVSWSASTSRDVAQVARWHAAEGGDQEWGERRARAVRLLAEADRVQAVADLVGAASLPDHERVVLLTGRLLREAVLQQNALSDNDAWAGAAKQAALLAMVLAIHDRAIDLTHRGVPGARIEELDFSDAARARDRVGPEDAAGVDAIRDALLARMEATGVRALVEHTRVDSVRGPLVVVGDVAGVGWDEIAEIRLASGEVRHGVVLDVHDDLAVVQVFEGTDGIGTEGLRVAFTGSPLRIPVGDGWLGRVCNGRGEPLDGGPPVARRGDARGGRGPDQPVAARDADASRCSPASPRSTAWPPSCAARSCRSSRSAACRIWSSPRRSPRRRARATSPSPSSSRRSGSPMPTRRRSAPRSPRAAPGDLTVLLNTADDPLIERLVTPQHRADDRRAPGLRGRPARARGHGRPDQLLRGAARGLGLARRDPVASRLPRAPLQRSRGAARAGRAHQGPGRIGHAAAGPDHARRRRHPSRAGHRRLHHRGPAGVLAGAARPGPVPPVRRAGLALAAHAAGRGSRPHARRPSRAGRPALRAGGAGAPGARAGRGARRGRAVGRRAPAGSTSPRR